ANGRCRLHGGVNHTPVKHGRFSKFLPVRLADRAAELLRDPDYLELKNDIALLDTRISELLERLDEPANGAASTKARALNEKAKRGGTEGAAARRELDELLEHGAADTDHWQEISQLLEQRRKLAEAETKHLALRQQFITAKEANLLVAAL